MVTTLYTTTITSTLTIAFLLFYMNYFNWSTQLFTFEYCQHSNIIIVTTNDT